MPSHTVRVLCEARSQSRSVRDAATGEVPFFWRGSSVVMQLGLVDNGQHLLRAGVGTIIVEVKALSATSADDSLMRKEFAAAACDASFVAADWAGGSKQLLAASFTLAEAAIGAGTYRLIIRHVAPDESEMTYLSAELRVVDPQAGSEGIDAPPVAWSYLEALPVVRTDIDQTLTDLQKSRGRANIGAESPTATNVTAAIAAASDAQAAEMREGIAAPELRGIDRLVNYRSAVYNGGAYRRPNILFFGDSMIGTAIATLRQQLESYGELSGWGLLPGVLGGTATIESDACVKWINGETWRLDASGEFVEFAYNGAVSVEGDTLKIYHLQQPGGGTFKIQSSVDGAAFADETGFTSINTDGALAGVVSTITKSTYAKTYKVRAVWVSGAVNIIGGGIRDSKRFGPIVSFVTNGSTSINNIDNASTTARAITDPVFADIAPNLIILSHLDGAANVTTYQGTLQDNITAGVVSGGAPTPSWLIVGPPIGFDSTQDALRVAQQTAMRTLADAREDSFYDNRTWALPVADVVSRGLITDTTHYTQAAQLQWIPSMFRELGIFDHVLGNRGLTWSLDIIGGGTFRGSTAGTPTVTQTTTTHTGALRLGNPAGGINQCFLILSDMAGDVNSNDAAILQYASNVFIMGLGAVSAFNWRNNNGQYEVYPTDALLNSRNGITANRWGVTYTGGISTAAATRTHTSTRTSGVTTNASPNITFAAAASGEIPPAGATITGTNIPGGTTIVSATATTAVLSANANGTGSGITFTIVAATMATATEKDNTFLCNAASGAITQPIPAAAAANAGLELLIKKIDSSGNAVTIGGTVDGALNPTITTQWDYRRIKSDGSAWYRIG